MIDCRANLELMVRRDELAPPERWDYQDNLALREQREHKERV